MLAFSYCDTDIFNIDSRNTGLVILLQPQAKPFLTTKYQAGEKNE